EINTLIIKMSINYRNIPYPIYIISGFFFLIPFISFFMTAGFLNIPFAQPGIVFQHFTIFTYCLMITSWLIGYGLIRAKKWAYYLFLLFSGVLIFYNITLWFKLIMKTGNANNLQLLTLSGIVTNTLFTVIIFGVILYFLQKEISAPYLSVLPRGWRNKSRDTIPVFVTWSDEKGTREQCRTKNISKNGMFIPLNDYDVLKPDDKVNIIIDLEESGKPVIELNGYVIRTMEPEEGLPGAGIRFIKDDKYKSGAAKLNSFIHEKYAPRFEISSPVSFRLEMSREVFSGNLYNLSSGGLYIETENIPRPGEIISVLMVKKPLKLELVGKVVWPNSEAKHYKQKGFGANIEYVKNPFSFAMLLWKLNLRSNLKR
ncbi:MAG: PilZ domain-containing protein, partial [Leptospira sp.]|nr:PilZ domain-containing protein [Leptospira sp.]